MTGAATDAALMGRVASGDAAALRILFERHQVRVFRFALRIVGSAALAEELTYEVFHEVWRHAARYRLKAAPVTWILAIAHHRAVSTMRKKREENWDEEIASGLCDTGDNPEVMVQKADKAAILRRCMDALSPAHKVIIDLVYYHEMSICDVGAVLRVPENTVKTRMFYARKQLARLLCQAGVDRGWP
jgi:RNA polymerase sigma-70 factor, ECF subfamily